ncbi:type IV pilus assembly protein PilA [Luteibacter sp. Sphag1AF]|uniref:pilin n=1 Tax=Luteibacter sp. Sphag1AF TaxID=2587031 RepID=UPI00161E82E8|nr:pilin [Luteibacter sp. Sphag1AF]MBB3225423.1 type IV pilus assembly protein PilA [Luteibacter sp. Sphag1AF]
MKNIQKGFTLIELMIVVAIIAILAAIAIPQYQNYIIRTQVSEGMNLADGAKTAVSEFYNNKGHWPTENASAGLAGTTSISGKYVASVDASNGLIVATFANKAPQDANDKINSKTVVLSAFDTGGVITWNCKSTAGGKTKTTVDEAYLPTACRK